MIQPTEKPSEVLTFGKVTHQRFERRQPGKVIFSSDERGVHDDEEADSSKMSAVELEPTENERAFLAHIQKPFIDLIQQQFPDSVSDTEIQAFAMQFFQMAEAIRQTELDRAGENKAQVIGSIFQKIGKWVEQRESEIFWVRLIPYGDRDGSYGKRLFTLWKEFSSLAKI